MHTYVPEDENEKGRGATSTGLSIFNSFDIKTLKFKFGHDIFTGFKLQSTQGLLNLVSQGRSQDDHKWAFFSSRLLLLVLLRTRYVHCLNEFH
jgi:hypothetical protein